MSPKQRVGDLAVFGGPPAFAEALHVGRPNLGDTDDLLCSIKDLLDRRWLSNNGVYVREFEQRVAGLHGVKHCVAVCNATVALSLTAQALGLDGEVIVPAFTSPATPHSVAWQGGTPVFCDVDPRTHCLDAGQAERLITPRTRGLLPVHLWGRPCDVDGLTRLARRHGLWLLFDAAHALACSHRGRMVGGFGDAEVLSFHATKVVGAGEGGAVLTDDDGLAARLRLMINFGFSGLDNVVALGTNGKMAELPAALALTNLDDLDAVVETNRLRYLRYRDRLAALPGVAVLPFDAAERNNYHYVVLEVDGARAPLTRDQLAEVLWAENVRARRYFTPGCHRMEPYRSTCPGVGARLPVTEALAERVLVLPTGQQIDLEGVDRVCALVAFALQHGASVRDRLNQPAPVAAARGAV
jgi:dTDP-4-amino-4,6-dideoxygalactose transaminase